MFAQNLKLLKVLTKPTETCGYSYLCGKAQITFLSAVGLKRISLKPPHRCEGKLHERYRKS